MNWISPARLKSLGILGMNRRNIQFIAGCNPRRLYPLVDNKLKTKQLAAAFDIPTPVLRFVVSAHYEIRNIRKQVEKIGGFAVKPAKGYGGKGILVISGFRNNRFIKTSGTQLRGKDLERHLSNIIAGLYSLAGSPDTALLEDIIDMDPLFDGYSFQGIPDIRVIVYKGYPAMAMLRLTTKASDGKANLHQGAVGLGLDIGSGKGLRALQFGKPVQVHPDTRNPLNDMRVPDWENLLSLAASCHEMTGMGYMGVDIVIDRNRGPLLLELNARPGLAIQMTNGEGLMLRLRKIDALTDKPRSVKERVSRVMELFGTRSGGVNA